jgi:hypothetical protein
MMDALFADKSEQFGILSADLGLGTSQRHERLREFKICDITLYISPASVSGQLLHRNLRR